jgi:SNF2 family DNA or RNA helicase
MVHEEHELEHEADAEDKKLWEEVRETCLSVLSGANASQERASQGPSAEQRLSRLKHLLDKSSLYADFLFNRMKEQEAERSAKATRAKKKKPAKENPQAKKRIKGDTDVILADILTEDDFRGSRSEPAKSAAAQEAETELPAGPPKDTFSRKLPDGRPISDRQPGLIVGAVLRDYQLVGVEWLKVCSVACDAALLFVITTFWILALLATSVWKTPPALFSHPILVLKSSW